MMARMPGQGVAASIGGPTTPGTATTEVQEQEVPPPPPVLHPPDFTNWSLPFPEAPVTGGLLMPSGGLPGIRGQTVGPRALGQRAPALPIQVPSTPQGMLPVHQLRPHQSATPYQQAVQLQSQPTTPYEQVVQPSSWPATPYQQAAQPPRRPAGRGLLARPPSDRAAPAPDQSIPDHGRQQARGRGIRGRSVSHPRQGRGMTTNAPSTITQGDTQSQPGRRSWPRHPDPAEMCSRSTTNTQCKPLSGSQSGLEQGNASSATSPQRRLRCSLLKRSPLWNTCHILPRSSIGLLASI